MRILTKGVPSFLCWRWFRRKESRRRSPHLDLGGHNQFAIGSSSFDGLRNCKLSKPLVTCPVLSSIAKQTLVIGEEQPRGFFSNCAFIVVNSPPFSHSLGLSLWHQESFSS